MVSTCAWAMICVAAQTVRIEASMIERLIVGIFLSSPPTVRQLYREFSDSIPILLPPHRGALNLAVRFNAQYGSESNLFVASATVEPAMTFGAINPRLRSNAAMRRGDRLIAFSPGAARGSRAGWWSNPFSSLKGALC